MGAPRVLVIDLGTTSTRLSVVTASGEFVATRRLRVPPIRDPAGWHGWDGLVLASRIQAEATALLDAHPVQGVAIANQRSSCVVWDAATHRPVGQIVGWADARTRELDRAWRARGVALVPGLTVSKARWLIDAAAGAVPAERLRAGTLDSWLLWTLTGGSMHATDHTNASHAGAFDLATLRWDDATLAALGLPASLLPEILPSTGPFAAASALPGAPPVLCMVGDQQAALAGHGLERPGSAKVTFGTGAVANVVLGDAPLPAPSRNAFVNVARSCRGRVDFGAESAVQSAGSSVEWLVGLGVLSGADALDAVVDPARRTGTATFVPAIDGLGAPDWNANARAVFAGLSAFDGRAELARAVVDGIACATADVLDGLEQACAMPLDTVSIDGGLVRSRAFVAILAATCGRRVVLAPDAEMTTLGAAKLAFEGLRLSFDLTGRADAADPVPAEDALPADRAAWRDARALSLQEARMRRDRPTATLPR